MNTAKITEKQQTVSGMNQVMFSSRDEPSNHFSSNFKSFKYKTSITGKTYDLCVVEAGYDGKKSR